MKCLLECCREMDLSVHELESFIPSLHKRIDTVQRYVCHYYEEHAVASGGESDRSLGQLHDDRLSMLGKMAASMAHEIRNPLTAIQGFIQLIRTEMNHPDSLNVDKVNGFLDIIENEFSGLYGQITSFLSFSKNDGLEEPYVLSTGKKMIESVLELVNPRLINENILVNLSLPCGKPLTLQKTGIQQVLSNLLNNSIHALCSVSHPKVISIRTHEDDSSSYIDVVDNGPGIPAEIQATIFTPFVTGKVNGDIRFTSRKGETKFTLRLSKSNG